MNQRELDDMLAFLGHTGMKVVILNEEGDATDFDSPDAPTTTSVAEQPPLPPIPFVQYGTFSHRKRGTRYLLLDFARAEHLPTMLLAYYVDLETGQKWVRPASEFFTNFRPENDVAYQIYNAHMKWSSHAS